MQEQQHHKLENLKMSILDWNYSYARQHNGWAWEPDRIYWHMAWHMRAPSNKPHGEDNGKNGNHSRRGCK
jgi:hypothetical protein